MWGSTIGKTSLPLSLKSGEKTGEVPDDMPRQGVPSCVKENSIRVRGVKLFNLLTAVLCAANHKDVLDHYLSAVPDQTTMHGLGCAASSNNLIHQVPIIGGWNV